MPVGRLIGRRSAGVAVTLAACGSSGSARQSNRFTGNSSTYQGTGQGPKAHPTGGCCAPHAGQVNAAPSGFLR
jgi:hypothetical protein